MSVTLRSCFPLQMSSVLRIRIIKDNTECKSKARFVIIAYNIRVCGLCGVSVCSSGLESYYGASKMKKKSADLRCLNKGDMSSYQTTELTPKEYGLLQMPTAHLRNLNLKWEIRKN